LAAFPARPQSDYDEALVHAKRAIELGPEKGAGYTALALTEFRLGHWSESLAATQHAMALENGGNASDWFLMSLVSFQTGEKAKARECFDKAVAGVTAKDSCDAELRQLRAEAAVLLGQPVEQHADRG
jgi:tetratricopeptide (TPR) repeat protein